MKDGAMSAVVIVPSATLAEVTALSANSELVTAPEAMSGFGYDPERSPPAPPDGADVRAVNATLAVSALGALKFAATSVVVIVPSAIFELVTAFAAIDGFGYDPVRSPPAVPVNVEERANVAVSAFGALKFDAISAVTIVPSAIFAEVTASSANSELEIPGEIGRATLAAVETNFAVSALMARIAYPTAPSRMRGASSSVPTCTLSQYGSLKVTLSGNAV